MDDFEILKKVVIPTQPVTTQYTTWNQYYLELLREKI